MNPRVFMTELVTTSPQEGRPDFRCSCAKCRKRLATERDTVWWDRSGEAFKAYYCDRCMDIARAEVLRVHEAVKNARSLDS